MIKLCVNIDHVATIREARKTVEPDPVLAAEEAYQGGADGITLHVREDRRHMQDSDLFNLRASVKIPLNFELAATPEMIELALRANPEMAMLVPEGRHEVTTEGGLDVAADRDRLKEIVKTLSTSGMQVSAFIDADPRQIDAAFACGFTVCEVHTGAYAEAVIHRGFLLDHPDVLAERAKVCEAVHQIVALGMQCNAGHGLTHHNVGGIASIVGIQELHIGHSIVSKSIFTGMKLSVAEMKQCIKDASK